LARRPQRLNRLVRIVHARQFHNDSPVALRLDNSLGHAQAIDAVIDDRLRRTHRPRIRLLALRQIRLQQNLSSASQIEAQFVLLEAAYCLRTPGESLIQPIWVVHRQGDVQCNEEKNDNQDQSNDRIAHKESLLQ